MLELTYWNKKQLAPINAEIVMKVAILYKRMQDDSRITVFAVVGRYWNVCGGTTEMDIGTPMKRLSALGQTEQNSGGEAKSLPQQYMFPDLISETR